MARLSRGVSIEGRRTAPAELQLRVSRSGEATLLITLREGRNRQVRKMCEVIGHPVTNLKRIAIGPIRDTRLKPGQWRELTAAEVKTLKQEIAD